MSEPELEPVPGLPEELPEGEMLLWQGAPDWRVLARHAFHLRALALYFACLLVLRVGTVWWTGNDLLLALQSVIALSALGLGAAGLFVLYAWLIARTTLYSLTNRRLVMRFGLALPMNINLPFTRIQAAAVKCYRHGYGDLPVSLDRSHRASYIVLWPHVRPWKFRRPEPMLRGIADADAVAERLADLALRAPSAATPANGDGSRKDLVNHPPRSAAVAAGEAT